jgi:UDP-glucose 4-epimerase
MVTNTVKTMELKNKKILVTGGAGFIGSHLVDKLLQMGNTVIIYDNFDDFYTGKEKNIEHVSENKDFRLIRDDILNFSSLASAMKDIDVLFHLAAQCGVRYSISHVEKTHRVNVDGTINVLMVAKQQKVKKIVSASSSGIFGDPVYAPMDEKHPTNPNSPYGVSKLAAEKYCVAFNKVYGLDITCLRYFSVYGPRGRPDQVIYAFISPILRGESPTIYGDGKQTRDFTFISDVVEATILAAECENIGGEVFNIGYGKEISINEVYAKILNETGKKGEIQPRYVESYKGEFSRTYADNKKAQRILEWKPKVEFNEGLRTFISWFTKI